MRVLGIDPGTSIIGYGVVDLEDGTYFAVDYGVILPESKDMSKKLLQIYKEICLLIDKYKPQSMAVEELFFNKNIKTALSVSQARGVILLAAEVKGVEAKGYTPLQVKQGITAYGRSTKEGVQMMVMSLLGLDEIPKPDDAADGLAIAITHLNSISHY